MSRSKKYKYSRKWRPRRHGLKLAGGCRCRCCYVPARDKAKEREMRRAEIQADLPMSEIEQRNLDYDWAEGFSEDMDWRELYIIHLLGKLEGA